METTTTTTSQRTPVHLESSLALDPIKLVPGFRGFVSGVVNTDSKQRLFVEVKGKGGETITSARFEGQGKRAPLISTFNHSPHWSFGPFDYEANLFVTISSYQGDKWVPSKMIGPFTITRQATFNYPKTFYVSTVISENGTNASNDDCTVTVVQHNHVLFSNPPVA